jgi:predicted acetyltransferase
VHEGRTRDLHAVPRADGINTRLATPDDYAAIEACYARVARHSAGFLDRGPRWWDRVFHREETQQIYVVGGTNGVDGYVRYRLHWDLPPGARVDVSELIADDPDVTRALWRLVASSSSIAEHVTFVGPPEHPLLFWLPDQVFDRRREWRWMARIIDAPGAIAARGYPPDAHLAIDVRVVDAQCDWNDARFRFVVDGGEGRLERGGAGAVELGIGAFSSLYTGYASAFTLAAAGLLRAATTAECAALDGVFAGPAPWMPDFY